MNLQKLAVFALMVIFSLSIGFIGCGKMTDKDKVMKVQKGMLDYIKSNDYKSLISYDITDEMMKDNAKMQAYMQQMSATAEKKMMDKQNDVFKSAGFNNENEFQLTYDKVKADPDVMALDKEISQTIETVSKAVNDANQKMIQEKTPKVPNDGTEVPGEKK
ncbi:MAG: hypothetical protein ABSF32_08765 [Ignavibacteria bacterium]|jgi:hypothetical protein